MIYVVTQTALFPHRQFPSERVSPREVQRLLVRRLDPIDVFNQSLVGHTGTGLLSILRKVGSRFDELFLQVNVFEQLNAFYWLGPNVRYRLESLQLAVGNEFRIPRQSVVFA